MYPPLDHVSEITQSVILVYRSSSTVFWSGIFDLAYRLVCNVCDRLSDPLEGVTSPNLPPSKKRQYVSNTRILYSSLIAARLSTPMKAYGKLVNCCYVVCNTKCSQAHRHHHDDAAVYRQDGSRTYGGGKVRAQNCSLSFTNVTKLMVIFSSDILQFSNFLLTHFTDNNIKTIMKVFTILRMCRYITLYNVNAVNWSTAHALSHSLRKI